MTKSNMMGKMESKTIDNAALALHNLGYQAPDISRLNTKIISSDSIRGCAIEAQTSHTQKLKMNAAGFYFANDDVFERIASRYDRICDLFSFGIHRLWKRRFIQIINNEPWHNLLDVASGTGALIYQLVHLDPAITPRLAIPDLHKIDLHKRAQDDSKFSNNNNNNSSSSSSNHNDKRELPHIVVSDMSTQMLKLAQIKLTNYRHCIQFKALDAHDMTSIASNSQEVVTLSLGLKILDRHKAFKEALRVLKPQGRLITLEVSQIPIGWVHRLYLKSISAIIPLIARGVAKGDTSTYHYFLKGLKAFPSATHLAQEMRDVGFYEVSFERLSMGTVAIHTARKG